MNINNKPLWQGVAVFILVLLIGGCILAWQFISLYADEIFKGFPPQVYFRLFFYSWQAMIPTLLTAAFLGLGILIGRTFFKDNSPVYKIKILSIVLGLAVLVTFYKGFILPTQKVNAFGYLYQVRNTEPGEVVEEKDWTEMRSTLECFNFFELKDSINRKKELLTEERPNAISFLTQYASTSQIDSVLQTTPAKALNLKKEDFPEHLLNPNASMSYANVCLMTEFFAIELKSTGILLKKLQWNYWDVIFSFFIYSIVTVLGLIIGY